MKLYGKIKSKQGFSIGELLVATLILLMVSSVVAGGIPVARDAYLKVTIGANSQVYLSTAITELRNELGTASNVKMKKSKFGNDIVYISGTTGSISKLSNETDGITITEYSFDPLNPDPVKAVESGKVLRTRVLVPKSPAPDNLYVSFTLKDVSDGVVEFEELTVKRDSDSKTYAEQKPLKIRSIGKQ